ncbi:hypothetical protein LOTGIDRAFT_208417 [Lottia gigantea]|uniref:FAS1 domain-containing protein n=1 Tax=Lottia gigantea TaxID=225164 RepID=V4BCJ9_LOTGI|nr:hypothetical protein LOTGIDRAFT_208417 [Lottia gigantea]ESP05386.1 hypothetical protein LOTGIDRAFT_208417 [Lottia gigantea]
MSRNLWIFLLILLSIIVIASSRRSRGRWYRGRSGRRSLADRLRDRGTKPSNHRPRQRHGWGRWGSGWGAGQDHRTRVEEELDDLFRRIKDRRYGFNFEDKFWLDFGWNSRNEPKPWWEGPNVCKDEKESIENTSISDTGPISRHFSFKNQVCDQSETSYKCTTKTGIFMKQKTVTEVYECCPGFTRKDEMFGCPTEFKLDGLVKTARNLGLTEFLRATESVSLTDDLEKGNFTVFAPVNKAFEDEKNILPELETILPKDMPSVVMVSKPLTDLVIADMSNVLLGHLVYDTLKTSGLNDEQLIETASPFDSLLRVNFFSRPEKLITVNCARILSADNQATNGIIHTVDRIIKPVTDSIVDIISQNPNLSYLKTALARADLVKALRGTGQYTLFAPTDAAFEKLEPSIRDRLIKGEKSCLEKVLKNHLLTSVICSTVIQGTVTTTNLLNKYLNLTRTEDDKLFVEGSQMVGRDIMATNGVIHVIEDVLVPDQALGLIDVAEKNNLTKFVELLKETGMFKGITKMENLTLFIPSNNAFEKLEEKVSLEELKKDKKKVEDIVMYHVVPEVVTCSRLHNNYKLSTENERNIRMNRYSTFPFRHHSIQTAQCAPIIKENVPACNGVINIVNEVLLPPVGNVVDNLASKKKFSTLVRLMKKSGLADMLQEEGPFTMFAPTNEAFDDLYEEDLEKIEDNPEVLKKVLQNHIVQEFVCCASISMVRSWFDVASVRTLSGVRFPVKERHGTIQFNHAVVTECDNTATNGVVHAIDKVTLSPERPFWKRDFYHW